MDASRHITTQNCSLQKWEFTARPPDRRRPDIDHVAGILPASVNPSQFSRPEIVRANRSLMPHKTTLLL
jgi:hypothetical protein